MQLDPNSVLIPSPPSGERARVRGLVLTISPEARDFICLHRPDLASDFETIGDRARIPLARLLHLAGNRPGMTNSRMTNEEEAASSGFRVPGSALQQAAGSQLGTRNFEPGTRKGVSGIPHSSFVIPLGDLLATLLHRLGIDAAIALLQRHGLLRGCRCAARQARLNALTPRLRSQVEPWSLTLAVLLAWLLFVVVLLAR